MTAPTRRPPSRCAQATQEPAAVPAPPPAPEVAPASVPGPVAEVPYIEDVTRDERLRRILVLWGSGANEAQVRRVILREFATTPDQVSRDLGDLRDELRSRLDDEGAIDMVMFGAAARANDIVDRFHSLAVTPIPDRILQVPSEDPDDPTGPGAIYRPPTPSETAALINAKAAAARTAIHALDFQTKLLGKRSQRWADKPSNVLAISVGKDGLTQEDRELLQSLGMAQ